MEAFSIYDINIENVSYVQFFYPESFQIAAKESVSAWLGFEKIRGNQGDSLFSINF